MSKLYFQIKLVDFSIVFVSYLLFVSKRKGGRVRGGGGGGGIGRYHKAHQLESQ